MLTNYHTHSTFCDGDNTPEETVKYAIENGFKAIGFSGHGYTSHDLRYCMRNESGYIDEIKRLKKIYSKEIQIYLGIEEDASEPAKKRADYDYILGSSHYILYNGVHNIVDSSAEHFSKTLSVFDGDIAKMAKYYYEPFCEYILKRKPDIVGHFDLVTKYDDVVLPGFNSSAEYRELSEKYMDIALTSECIFEVNTGAMAKGYRNTPYPDENLLYLIKKRGGKLTVNSDCHFAHGLDFGFKETKKMLKDIGFQYTYILYDNEFKKDYLQ